MKSNTKLLIGILIISLVFRLYSLSFNSLIGNDPFVHASVIRQYLETGNLETYELTGGQGVINEPKGLYWVAILPALMGVPYIAAFQLMPVLFGVIGVLLFYYLMRYLFNNRVALIGSLMLGLNVAHIYRTMANSYRGDGFFLTFFLGLMLVYTLFINEEKKNRQLILSGLSILLITGMMVVWNGHLLGVFIILSWVMAAQLIAYYRRDAGLTKKLFLYSSIIFPSYLLVNLLLSGVNFITGLFFNTPSSRVIHTLFSLLPVMLGVVFTLTVKLKKQLRTALIIGLFGSALVFIALFLPVITDILSRSIFFTSTIYTAGVAELLPPTSDLLWLVHNLSFYLMWPGLILFSLSLFKLKNYGKLAMLFYTIPVLFLMLNYSRYVFQGSIITVSMAALIIDYSYLQLRKVKQLKKFVIALPVGLLIASFYFGIMGVGSLTPRVSEPWVSELEFINDYFAPGKVLSWWDHGSWIQYYTGFPTVVDSVYGQVESTIQRIARFLVTDNNDTFSDLDPDYLIIGYDIILYINAIMTLADETGLEIVLPSAYETGYVGGESVIKYIIGNGYFEVYDQKTIFRTSTGQSFLVPKTIVSNGTHAVLFEVDTTGFEALDGCFLNSPGIAAYFNEKACNSNYFNLMFAAGKEGYTYLHGNGYVRIYSVNNP